MNLQKSVDIKLNQLCLPFILICISISTFAQKCCQDWKSAISKETFLENVSNETLTYRMLLNGDSMGNTITTYQVDQNSISIKEEVEAIYNGKLMKESIYSRFNYNRKEMEKGSLTINYDGNEVDIAAEWTKDGVRLTSSAKDSLIVSISNLQRFLGVFLLPKLMHDHPHGNPISYNQFYMGDAGIREVTLSPAGKTFLVTQLGRKDVDIVKAEGGLAEQVFYIDQINHRIVQIEIPNMGWVYEIICIETSE